ncbi:S1C family serine protease, partial [Thermanaerothrix sp.]
FIATTTDGEIESLGSGFVYDREGHIVTNYHVVEGASGLEVFFPSGLKVRAKVIGQDLDSDLAVIKVDVPADALVPLPLGDSDQVRVGQTAIAIGNPFGLTGTMTVGIVSAKGRTLESLRQAESGTFFSAGDVIQTDASINPGNSGGPLLNLAGEVIGVNRAIRTTGTTITGEPVNSGIGFAVSSNIVRRVVPVLITQGRYDYPYLGISSREMLTLEQIEALGLPRQTGAYIVSVTPGSPADRAGLRGGSQPTRFAGLPAGGDLIIAIDGQPVQTFSDMLSYLMKNKSPGDTVVLTIIRDRQEKEVSVTLGKRP